MELFEEFKSAVKNDDMASVILYGSQMGAENCELKAENAELKARLDKAAELPCKVGDTVYRAVSEWEGRHCLKDAFVPYVENFKVGGFYINIRDEIIVLKKFDELYVFGETVFLTEAEAQAKLDEVKGGADKCNG